MADADAGVVAATGGPEGGIGGGANEACEKVVVESDVGGGSFVTPSHVPANSCKICKILYNLQEPRVVANGVPAISLVCTEASASGSSATCDWWINLSTSTSRR